MNRAHPESAPIQLTDPIVFYPEYHPVCLLVQLQPALRGFGMSNHVGQGLAHHKSQGLICFSYGDAGCEVMSLPSILTGQRTHLACIAFSPIDCLEARVMNRFGGITQDSAA